MTFTDHLFRSLTKGIIALLFFGFLLVASAHYRVVPFHAPESQTEKMTEKCSQNSTAFPTGVIMYGTDNAPHLFTDKRHVVMALEDQFGKNGAKPAHVLAISMFCH